MSASSESKADWRFRQEARLMAAEKERDQRLIPAVIGEVGA